MIQTKKAQLPETVSIEHLKQVMWERDVAIRQLNEIGKGFGEKMDDVRKVVFCKDCRYRSNTGTCQHPRFDVLPTAYPFDFCSYGTKF